MTASDIETLIAAQASLIAALDSGEVVAIEATTAALSNIVARLGASGVVANVNRDRVDHALRQSEAARSRVNYLADRTKRRAEYINERRGKRLTATYNASGRVGGVYV